MRGGVTKYAASLIVTVVTVMAAGSERPEPRVLAIAEQSAAGTVVGAVLDGTADEPGAARRYQIIGGNERGLFEIDAETGLVSVRDGSGLDYERETRHELRVRVEHSGPADESRRRFAADLIESGVDEREVAEFLSGTEEVVVVIDVTDAPEAPVLAAQRVILVWPNEAMGEPQPSIEIAARDDDAGDRLHYEILAGDPDGLVQIDRETGRMSLSMLAEPKAGRHRLPLTVRVTDSAGLSDAATFPVELIRMPASVIAATEPSPAAVAVEEPPADSLEPAPSPASEPEPEELPNATAASSGAAAVPEEAETAEPSTIAAAAPVEVAPSSGGLSGFLPMLIVIAAGLITFVFLRWRQRSRTESDDLARAHAAETLARPLPSWLSGKPAEPRSHEMISVTEERPMDSDSDGQTESGDASVTATHEADDAVAAETVEPAVMAADDLLEADEVFAAPTPSTDDASEHSLPEREVRRTEVMLDVSWLTPDGDDLAAEAAAPEEFPNEPDDQSVPTTSQRSTADAEEHQERGESFELTDSPEDADEVLADTYALHEEPSPEPAERGSAEDEVSYVGGWTQDEMPYDDRPYVDRSYDAAEADAVQGAGEALDESSCPLGVDPRVAELRAQLSNMFGIPSIPRSADALPESEPVPEVSDSGEPDEAGVAEPGYEPTGAMDFAEHLTGAPESEEPPIPEQIEPTVAEVTEPAAAPDNDPVRSWLEYLKNRNAPAPAAEPAAAKPSAAPSPSVTATAPVEPQAFAAPVPVMPSAPQFRQNKSAVRLEISQLRDLANRHTRGVLAVRASEQKARLWWFLSGAGMVVLCFVSMWLVGQTTPFLKWLGWGALSAAAINLAICINSFGRLRSQAERESEEPDVEGDAEHTRGTEEGDLLTPEMEARLDSILHSEEPEPAEARV